MLALRDLKIYNSPFMSSCQEDGVATFYDFVVRQRTTIYVCKLFYVSYSK